MIKEKVSYGDRKPAHAEGYACIELTDPITGKVKDRVDGKNHVFVDSLFCFTNSGDWKADISTVPMWLMDTTTPIDPDFPFLLGNIVGYGVPSTDTLGTYRGAYNAESQVLAQQTIEKTRWKFVYNFTTPQANSAAIRAVGLTFQCTNKQRNPFSNFTTSCPGEYSNYVSDGRYQCICSSSGIVTKRDAWFNTLDTIDVSSVVGSTTSNAKSVGYNPQTGNWAILVTSSTAGSRKFYVFSDNTFTTLLNTYSPSAFTQNSQQSVYFYGDYFFYCYYYNGIYSFNYVTNSNAATLTTTPSNYSKNERATSGIYYGTNSAAYNKYILSLSPYTTHDGIIFDMDEKAFVGYTAIGSATSGHSCPVSYYPVTTNKLWGFNYYSDGRFASANAVTCYNLPAPITKTSAYAMTATYELEVFW